MLRGPPFFRPQQLLESLCSFYWIRVASIRRHWRWNSHRRVKPNENSFCPRHQCRARREQNTHLEALLRARHSCFHHPTGPATPSAEKFLASLSQITRKFPGWLSATTAAVFKGIFSPLSLGGRPLPVSLASHPLYSAEGEGVLLDPVALPSMGTEHAVLTAKHLSGATVAELTHPRPCFGTWLQSILSLSKPSNSDIPHLLHGNPSPQNLQRPQNRNY